MIYMYITIVDDTGLETGSRVVSFLKAAHNSSCFAFLASAASVSLSCNSLFVLPSLSSSSPSSCLVQTERPLYF